MKRTIHTLLRYPRMGGFTLIELMTTIAIVAVLASIVVPNMRTFILNNRLTATANNMLRSIQMARTQATRLQRNIVVCTSANPIATTPTCSKTSITGWIVFQDTNNNWDHDAGEEFIEAQTFESTKMYLLADQDMRFSFSATGFANSAGAKTPSTAIVMCDSRGTSTVGGQSTARGLIVTPTGRARITRVVSDITTLLGSGKINSSCPP